MAERTGLAHDWQRVESRPLVDWRQLERIDWRCSRCGSTLPDGGATFPCRGLPTSNPAKRSEIIDTTPAAPPEEGER
jgi:hypothetical protein